MSTNVYSIERKIQKPNILTESELWKYRQVVSIVFSNMPMNVFDIARLTQKPDRVAESELLRSYAIFQGDEDLLIEQIL